MTESTNTINEKPVVPVVDVQPEAAVASPTQVVGPVAKDNTSTIVTIILLVVMYPVGVILMWIWPKWSKLVKVLLTVPVVLGVVLALWIAGQVATNPDLKKGMGLVGSMAECSQYQDKAKQEQCLGTKAAEFAVAGICEKEGATSKACVSMKKVKDEYLTCLQTKTLSECESVMKSVGEKDTSGDAMISPGAAVEMPDEIIQDPELAN